VTLDVPAFTREDWSLYLSLLPSRKIRRAGLHWVLVDTTIPYAEFSEYVSNDELWTSLAKPAYVQTLFGMRNVPPSDAPSCRANLERRNGMSVRVVAHREVSWVKVVPGEEVKAAFERGFWREFKAEFPQALGVMRCSLPGFSPDGSSAVVHTSWSSGPLAGWGGLIYVKKGPKGWVQHASWRFWIS
jgi:hypothetical protein